MIAWLTWTMGALAQPAPPTDVVTNPEADTVPVTVYLAGRERPDPAVVPYESSSQAKYADPICALPCTFELAPGKHRLAVRTGSQLVARRTLKVQAGEDPITLKARPLRVVPLVGYGVSQILAAAFISDAVRDDRYLCDLVSDDPVTQASCRTDEENRRASSRRNAAIFQAISIPFLVFTPPVFRRTKR